MKPPPFADRVLVSALRLLATFLGLVGFLLVVLWVAHSFGNRPSWTLSFFGPALQLTTTDDGYTFNWFSISGSVSSWVLPAGSFEPLGAFIAALGSFVAAWLSRSVDRRLPVEVGQQPIEPRTINTEGGDYAEENIDKRQGTFVEGSTVHGNVIGQQIIQQAATTTPTLHQLRAPTADFVGRETEMQQLVEALTKAANRGTAAAISGVRGMGGIGKTELAYRVAHELRDTFPDGQLFIELRGATSPVPAEEALKSLIRAFERESQLPDNLGELKALYNAKLTGRRILVLADDAQDAAQVRPLMPPAGCALLLTSRNRFALPGMATLDLEVLPPVEADELLLDICSRIADHAPKLARLCGYLPLALRVSAGLLANSAHPVENYVRQLEQERLKHLMDPDIPDDPQASVEASLRLSYDALNIHGQFVLWQFAILPPGLTSEWLPRVLQSDLEPMEVVQLLYRRNLVQWDAESGGYKLHDLVFDFARARGQAAFEQQTQTHRQQGDLERTISALSWLVDFYERGGKVDKAIAAYREMNHLARITGDTRSEIGALDKIGSILGRIGRREQAIAHHEQALQRAREVDSAEWIESSFLQLRPLYEAAGRLEDVVRIREARLEEARKKGTKQRELDALKDLASAFDDIKDTDRAIALFEEFLALNASLGKINSDLLVWGRLWNLYAAQGKFRKAAETLQSYINILRSTPGTTESNVGMEEIFQQLEDEYRQLLERVNKGEGE